MKKTSPFMQSFEQLPDTLAIFPLSNAVVMPGSHLPLNIFEPRYLNMIDDALKHDRLIGMVQSDGDKIRAIGGLGRVIQFSETDDGRYIIVLKGLKRFTITEELPLEHPYKQARVSYVDFSSDPDFHMPEKLPEALSDVGGENRAALTIAMKSFAKTLQVDVDWDALAEIPLPRLIDQASMISPFKAEDKQSLLEAKNSEERRRLLIGLMHLYAANLQDSQKGQMN